MSAMHVIFFGIVCGIVSAENESRENNNTWSVCARTCARKRVNLVIYINLGSEITLPANRFVRDTIGNLNSTHTSTAWV